MTQQTTRFGARPLPRCPRLRWDAITVRIDRDSAVVGLDPEHCALVIPHADEVIAWLRALDGRTDLERALAQAPPCLRQGGEARTLLQRLDALGLLCDDTPQVGRQAQGAPVGVEVGSELRDLQVRHGATSGRAVLQSRSRRRIGVQGDEAIAAPLVDRLRSAGLGRASSVAGGAGNPDSDLWIVVGPYGLARGIDELLTDEAMRRGQAHLGIEIGATSAMIGDLVLPGRTPCLRCVMLLRNDLRPTWSLTAAHAGTRPLPVPSAHNRDLLQGLIVSAVLRAIDALLLPAQQDVVGRRGLRVDLHPPRLRHQRIDWHPRCGCREPLGEPSLAPPLQAAV